MRPRIIDVVFEGLRRPRFEHLVVGLGLALAIHSVPWIMAVANVFPRERDKPPARVAEVSVELERPQVEKPPPKEEPPPEPPKPEPPVEKPAPKIRHEPAVQPTSPAQAAHLAGEAEPDPAAPVDLTGETFVTGDAVAFAGGVTAREGKSDKPVLDKNVSLDGVPNQKPPKETPPDRSAPVRLHDEEWHCPWPSEAEDSAIDAENVTIRVTVDETGRVESAEIVRDPGHGFGGAAIACAYRTRFVPARDPRGRPIKSPSPPIRVHFRR